MTTNRTIAYSHVDIFTDNPGIPHVTVSDPIALATVSDDREFFDPGEINSVSVRAYGHGDSRPGFSVGNASSRKVYGDDLFG